MNVTELAKACGLSRGTVLYYESIGLLPQPPRSPSNYRRYGPESLVRLRQIRLYRDSGLKLEDIRKLLDPAPGGAAAILERRLAELEGEIDRLRSYQRAIIRMLQDSTDERRIEDMTKDKWVEIMRATGFTDDDMHRWHRQFERSAPEDHQAFLEFLNITSGEIERIRAWSRSEA